MTHEPAPSRAPAQTRLEAIGCWISAKAADIAAHPFAQLGLVLVCVAWFLFAWRVDWLTAILSILAITLTQMVLNRQHEREKEAHRRDVALHAKLDELLHASKRARDELAGIEELEEEQIEELKAGAPQEQRGEREAIASSEWRARRPAGGAAGTPAEPVRRRGPPRAATR